ncbi:MAG: hypothetical protein FK730_13055 [Asgard group archaeon]|nr:hypothetical protein [Asgard group archaeon]
MKKNHKKEEEVNVILHKRKTGKSAPNHRQQIEVAICYGWIDTVVKRVNEDTYLRKFVKRKKNANWSKNTLSYGKKLFKEGKMSKQGIEAYERGLKKLPHDHNIPENLTIPKELKKALSKNKKAKTSFEKLPPSYKKMLYRWFFRAKLQETRNKRVKKIIEFSEKGKKLF